MHRFLLAALVLGCAEEEEKDDGTGIMIEGTISLDDRDGAAIVRGVRAFGYNADGRMLVFISNNTDATCNGVSELLGSGGATVDPSDIYVAGTCYMLIAVDGYDGGFSHTYSEGTGDYSLAVSSAIGCAMGDGDFELVDTVNGPGYQWTGTWWVGAPTAYAWDFTGGDGDDLELDMRMTRYQGSLPLSTEYVEVQAEGIVEGVVTAKWCPELADASTF
jgi:hypothetical protein